MANRQILGRFIQTPSERKQYTADYTDWLATGETVTSITSFTISPTTAPALVVNGSAIDGTGKLVSFFVSGGVTGTQYSVLVLIATSTGQIKQDEVLFTIEVLS